MGLVIIFGLVTIVAVFASLGALKSKNKLGLLFAGVSVVVFGWFTVMTVINDGYPAIIH